MGNPWELLGMNHTAAIIETSSEALEGDAEDNLHELNGRVKKRYRVFLKSYWNCKQNRVEVKIRF